MGIVIEVDGNGLEVRNPDNRLTGETRLREATARQKTVPGSHTPDILYPGPIAA